MSFVLPRALLSKAAHPAFRAAGRSAGRRTMSSGAPHGAHAKSDMPWIIGSALVFIPTAAYLIAPPGKEKAHEAEEAALPKHKIPDPENAPVPASPEPEAEAAPAEPEAEAKSEDAVTDDEGTKAPASEVQDSVNKAVEEDAPKEAAAAEAESSKSEDSESTPAKEPAEADTEAKGETSK